MLFRTTADVRSIPAVAWIFDATLAVVLDQDVRSFEGLNVAQLVALVTRPGPPLRGRSLAALLWWLARYSRTCVRPLERKLARWIEPLDLLSSGSALGAAAPLLDEGAGTHGSALAVER